MDRWMDGWMEQTISGCAYIAYSIHLTVINAARVSQCMAESITLFWACVNSGLTQIKCESPDPESYLMFKCL